MRLQNWLQMANMDHWKLCLPKHAGTEDTQSVLAKPMDPSKAGNRVQAMDGSPIKPCHTAAGFAETRQKGNTVEQPMADKPVYFKDSQPDKASGKGRKASFVSSPIYQAWRSKRTCTMATTRLSTGVSRMRNTWSPFLPHLHSFMNECKRSGDWQPSLRHAHERRCICAYCMIAVPGSFIWQLYLARINTKDWVISMVNPAAICMCRWLWLYLCIMHESTIYMFWMHRDLLQSHNAKWQASFVFNNRTGLPFWASVSQGTLISPVIHLVLLRQRFTLTFWWSMITKMLCSLNVNSWNKSTSGHLEHIL